MRLFLKLKPVFLLLTITCPITLFAQETTPSSSPFGCADPAVTINLDRKPRLKFVPIGTLPEPANYSTGHPFDFKSDGPFKSVEIYFNATIPELPIGRASQAKLGVFARTYEGQRASGGGKLWQLVTEPLDANDERPSHHFIFHAMRVATCTPNNQGTDSEVQCSFADVQPAAENDVPLLDLSFKEDLGGANADNWTESHLLLDFRSNPPRVLVTADCDYNEGGGACTAIDSGEMTRSALDCNWAGNKSDFLCNENGEVSHRDFYLLDEKAQAPLRSDEVKTLQVAVEKFRTDARAKLKVRGFGVASFISKIPLSASRDVLILASGTGPATAADFYFIEQDNGRLGTPIVVRPRSFDQTRSGAPVSASPADSTFDRELTFSTKRIYEDNKLTVLQVVSANAQYAGHVYWLGIPKGIKPDSRRFDAVQIATSEGSYAGCGQMDDPASVIRLKQVLHPFKAEVEILPPTTETAAGEISWGSSQHNCDEQAPADCLRTGSIRWTKDGFRGLMREASCKTEEKPKFLHIANDGTITLKDATEQ